VGLLGLRGCGPELGEDDRPISSSSRWYAYQDGRSYMTTNEKIVKQGFEIHGCRFIQLEGELILHARLSLQELTEICRTITRVVGFGLPGNDADDHT